MFWVSIGMERLGIKLKTHKCLLFTLYLAFALTFISLLRLSVTSETFYNQKSAHPIRGIKSVLTGSDKPISQKQNAQGVEEEDVNILTNDFFLTDLNGRQCEKV